jgi:hypothetical protein
VVKLAKGGHPVALQLCLERLFPPQKDCPITLKGVEDLPKVLVAILEAVAQGEIPPKGKQTLPAIQYKLPKVTGP